MLEGNLELERFVCREDVIRSSGKLSNRPETVFCRRCKEIKVLWYALAKWLKELVICRVSQDGLGVSSDRGEKSHDAMT